MLGKLFKHEFKDTCKIIFLLYAVVVVATLLYSITLFSQKDQGNTNMLGVSMLILYVLTLVALYVVTAIYSCWHFYKTTYSDQGYLTHTLPVKPLAILHSKLVTAWIWMSASFLLMLISLFFVLNAVTGGELWSELIAADWQAFLREWENFGNMPFGKFIGYIVCTVILKNLHFLLMVYAAASVGQLFSNNKLGFSIMSGIVFYFAEQILNVILLITVGNKFLRLAMTSESVQPSPDSLIPVLNGSFILMFAFTVIYYVISAVILRKHVNLD